MKEEQELLGQRRQGRRPPQGEQTGTSGQGVWKVHVVEQDSEGVEPDEQEGGANVTARLGISWKFVWEGEEMHTRGCT